jgi:hypothetical protein
MQLPTFSSANYKEYEANYASLRGGCWRAHRIGVFFVPTFVGGWFSSNCGLPFSRYSIPMFCISARVKRLDELFESCGSVNVYYWLLDKLFESCGSTNEYDWLLVNYSSPVAPRE